MRLGGYVCIAIFLAGLSTWAASYLLEPKLFMITGNLKSFRTEGSAWIVPISGLTPSSQDTNTSGAGNVTEEIGNTSMAVLKAHYGVSVNVSRTLRAVVEDPSGSRVGVGFIIEDRGGQKLVVVLPDGWVQEYAIPAKG